MCVACGVLQWTARWVWVEKDWGGVVMENVPGCDDRGLKRPRFNNRGRSVFVPKRSFAGGGGGGGMEAPAFNQGGRGGLKGKKKRWNSIPL